MDSLNVRLLITASIVLALFLGLTGLVLDQAFRQSAIAATEARLRAQVLLLLGAADVDESGLAIAEDLPEPRLSTPTSGLYADIVTEDGRILWQSPSAVAGDVAYPAASFGGGYDVQKVESPGWPALFAMSFGVIWELEDAREFRFVVRVAETTASFDQQVWGFRRSLWVWFTGAALALLIIQGLVLRWGLAPLRRVAAEIREIEAGRRTSLSESYPRELRTLTHNLNELVRHGQSRLQRYRHALDDLAHSLKTPLAVLRNLTQSEDDALCWRETVEREIERMHHTIDYQLQRAATAGRVPLAVQLDAVSVARRLGESLMKVHAGKKIALEVLVQGDVKVHGDENDFTELLGNLMDNAFRWAQTKVTVRFADNSTSSDRLSTIIDVEDDGPGFDSGSGETALKRGARSHGPKGGQGIGLAVVREIVDLYGGEIRLESSALGGARVRVVI